MLSHIPRMEAIAQMIEHQNTPAAEIKGSAAGEKREIEFGAQLLRTGLVYDALLRRGIPAAEACRRVRATVSGVDPSLLAILSDLQLDVPMRTRECYVHELAVGMILQQDLYANTGLLIAAKGQELSLTWIDRLKAYSGRGVIPNRLKVQLPESEMKP